MREIKFRAWNRVQQIISEPFALNNITANKDFVVGIPGWDCCDSFSAVIFLEYTNLKDKNGVEIYEGDILKVPADYCGDMYFDECNAKVYFSDGCFMTNAPNCMNFNRCEVIGNIFENPELLEG